MSSAYDPPLWLHTPACVFRILTQRNYEANKKLDKALKKKKGVTRASLDRFGTHDPELSKLKRLADAETEDNVLEDRRQCGKSLVYGQVIQVGARASGPLGRADGAHRARRMCPCSHL